MMRAGLQISNGLLVQSLRIAEPQDWIVAISIRPPNNCICRMVTLRSNSKIMESVSIAKQRKFGGFHGNKELRFKRSDSIASDCFC